MSRLNRILALSFMATGAAFGQASVYSLQITPPSAADSALPLNVAATMRVNFQLPDEVWDTQLILETASASSTLSSYPDNVTSVDCPSNLQGSCYEVTFLFAFDASHTLGTYLPTALLAYYEQPSWTYKTLNLNPAALQAAGITATFTLFQPGGGGGGGNPSCPLQSVAGGSPGSGISDTTPPELASGACVSPLVVDVQTSPQTVTYSFRVKDDLAGFSYGWLYLYSPTSSQNIYTYFDAFSARTSGNEFDGIYSVSIIIPQGATPGTWTGWLNLYDATGNGNYVQPMTEGTPDNPAGFEVISVEDTAAPVIQSITYSVPSVDVSAGSQTVMADIRITDVGTGFDPLNSNSYIYFNGPTTATKWEVWAQYQSQVSGNAQDGVYRYAVTVPRYSEPGAWRISYAYLRDFAGGTSSYDRTFNPPPATAFTVTSVPADNAMPVVTSVSVVPAFINTSAADQVVDMNFTVTDNLSGIRTVYPGYEGCYGFFYSPSGQQYRGGVYASRISGTALSGAYNAKIPFARYSEIGTWELKYLVCEDGATNRRVYNTTDLAALGFNAKISVIQPSNNQDGTVPPSGGTVTDNASSVSITFPPGSVASDTTISIDVLALPPAIPAPAGFSRGTGFVVVDLNPKPAAPFPAPGVTITIPLENQLPAGLRLILYKVDPVTGTLVPAPKVGGGPVEGLVDLSGLTATFTGVSGFSTVVGLIPPARVGDLNGDDQVNCEDVGIIRSSWNKRLGQVGFDERADFNRDKVVNLLDLAAVSRYLPRRTRCN